VSLAMAISHLKGWLTS